MFREEGKHKKKNGKNTVAVAGSFGAETRD